jgi:hypothetical protein
VQNLSICLLCLIITYIIDLSRRKDFVIAQQAEIEFDKLDNILSYLLPEFVKK